MSTPDTHQDKDGENNIPPPPYSGPYNNASGGQGPDWSGKANQAEYGPSQGYAPSQGYPQPVMYVQGYPGIQPGQMMVQYPVVQAQPLIGPPIQGPPVRDYMVMAIVATVFCFFPTGIAAIMKASEVKSSLASGDTTRALQASERAKKLIYISIVLGIICYVGLVILVVLASRYLHEMYMQQLRRQV